MDKVFEIQKKIQKSEKKKQKSIKRDRHIRTVANRLHKTKTILLKYSWHLFFILKILFFLLC